ncbi:hypothetical protein GGI20_002580 [Coemansia sp. BCRC 34301]|nr:hypothetical protein GGI20_002580 [Coemansia sp. BCRC 34301]
MLSDLEQTGPEVAEELARRFSHQRRTVVKRAKQRVADNKRELFTAEKQEAADLNTRAAKLKALKETRKASLKAITEASVRKEEMYSQAVAVLAEEGIQTKQKIDALRKTVEASR